MKQLGCLLLCVGLLCVVGCNTLSKKIKKLELGMTPDQVREQAGSPYAIRAAKVYDDGRTEEVWEYLSRYALYPKDYWVFFENGKVVQWGEPGDFSGLTSLTGEVPVKDYTPVKKAQ